LQDLAHVMLRILQDTGWGLLWQHAAYPLLLLLLL
jgi:hypothetical protein